MGTKDARVDAYIEKAQPFAKPILKHLRKVVHAGCPEVVEDLKWSHPAFMYKGILCGMAAFKAHVTFGFWNQAVGATPKVKEAAGQFGRITSVDDLPSEAKMIAMVKEAVKMHDAGVKPTHRKTAPKGPIDVPDYFEAALKKNRKAKAVFDAFAPSHRREYVEWITDAKQEATRDRRIATAIEWIAQGKQRNWKYM